MLVVLIRLKIKSTYTSVGLHLDSHFRHYVDLGGVLVIFSGTFFAGYHHSKNQFITSISQV